MDTSEIIETDDTKLISEIMETDETKLKSQVYDVMKEFMEENPDADYKELGMAIKGAMKGATGVINIAKKYT